MERIAIVGLGMMGGSLGAAIRKYRKTTEVIGISRSSDTIKEAIRRNIIHRGTTALEDIVNTVDIVFIATPVKTIPDYIKKISSVAEKELIVTDIGSTKEFIWKEIKDHISPYIHFIGGHPLTGSEKQGLTHATSELYRNSTYVLIPYTSNTTLVDKLLSVIESIGSRVVFSEAKRHDAVLGLLSHLTHLIAYALMLSCNDLLTENELKALIPPSFKDLTRVASSSADIWIDIFKTNDLHIHQAVRLFSSYLSQLDTMIDRQPDDLRSMLEKAREVKKKIERLT